MTQTSFQRYQCWRDDRVGQVINTEAISVESAEFMATHAPLSQIRYLRSPYAIANTSESGLYDELLRASQESRHAFVLIQGIPGTGKSHIIRWLERCYRLEGPSNDLVILIERAENSLLSTLHQIIDKVEFSDEAMRQQLAKLKGATEQLSNAALKDSILDNLRVATYEQPLPPSERPRPRIANNIERFLLDPVVREDLKRADGPIERISRFLAIGNRTSPGDERPEFTPDDFELKTEVLYAIRDQGYREARELADALKLKDALRAELATYLNRLLDYVIRRTTMLSADDIKQTFNSLRRHLRAQGRSLVLFIEDITAITGLDVGLIDVLVTQHTGESNAKFCRLTSVVGVTDYYFRDRFPDNLKERVTHQLTLSTDQQGRSESELLQNPGTTADMAARYLNAMRVGHLELNTWLSTGGGIANIPNKCATCPHRVPCHTAFGAVNIADEEGELVEVGLYPFNEQALWTMYRQIDTTNTTRTPRSLLKSVLLYVLQSHGPKVAEGTFPPQPREVGSDFRPPSLAKGVQQRILDVQAGRDAQRIESLVLFWGDRTIDTQEGPNRTVGGLSGEVFRAFALPFISGEGTQLSARSTATIVATDPDPKPTNPPPQPPSPVVEAQKTKFDDAIARWRQGEKLTQHEDLRRYISRLILISIDWEGYGLAQGVVEDRLGNARRIQIEGQTGQTVGDSLLFERSAELGYVLQALADLNTRLSQLGPATIAGHIATVSAWLRREEPRIVEHARRPTADMITPMRLTELLLLSCLFIEASCDSLRSTASSTRDLLLNVIDGSADELGDKPLSEAAWRTRVERARIIHGKAWGDIMRNMGALRVQTCRRELLRALNRPQGDSQDVRFVDAAIAMDIIRALKQRGWALRSISAVESTSSPSAWRDGTYVYGLYAERMEKVVEEERTFLIDQLGRLGELLGQNSPEEALKVIEATLANLRERQVAYTFTDAPAGGRALATAQQFLRDTSITVDLGTAIVRLSAGQRYVEQIQAFTRYFEEFSKVAQQINSDLERRAAKLRSEGDAHKLQEEAEQRYVGLADRLRALTIAVEEA